MSDKYIDFETRTSVHITLTRSTHAELRKILIDHKLSMQEVFREFTHSIVTRNDHAISMLEKLLRKWLQLMLNLFLGRSKVETHSQKVKELEEHVCELNKRVDDLTDALVKTQDVLASVTRAQSEFLFEFETLIKPAILMLNATSSKASFIVTDDIDSGSWN